MFATTPLLLGLLFIAASCRTLESPPQGQSEGPVGPAVIGAVDYRERELLPTPADLEVELVKVLASGDDEEILGTWFRVNPGSVPIAFEVPYELGVIDSDATYVVRAWITGEDGRLWQTTRLFPVELVAEADRVRAVRALPQSEPGAASEDAGPDGTTDGADEQDETLDIGRVVLTKVPRRNVTAPPAPSEVAESGPEAPTAAAGAVADIATDAGDAGDATGAPVAVEPVTVLVTGRLFRQPDVLPAGSLLSVRLIEVPEDGSAEVVVADVLFDDPAPGPVPFELVVDFALVDPGRPHSVRATLVGPEGRTLFQTTSLFTVTLNEPGGTVDVGRILLVKVPR